MLRATTACNFSSLIWPAGSAPVDSPGATNYWKNTVNRDFPTFSRISIFFLLTLSLLLFSLLIFLFSLPLPCSASHLSILSEVWLLNFLRSWEFCAKNFATAVEKRAIHQQWRGTSHDRNANYFGGHHATLAKTTWITDWMNKRPNDRWLIERQVIGSMTDRFTAAVPMQNLQNQNYP